MITVTAIQFYLTISISIGVSTGGGYADGFDFPAASFAWAAPSIDYQRRNRD